MGSTLSGLVQFGPLSWLLLELGLGLRWVLEQKWSFQYSLVYLLKLLFMVDLWLVWSISPCRALFCLSFSFRTHSFFAHHFLHILCKYFLLFLSLFFLQLLHFFLQFFHSHFLLSHFHHTCELLRCSNNYRLCLLTWCLLNFHCLLYLFSNFTFFCLYRLLSLAYTQIELFHNSRTFHFFLRFQLLHKLFLKLGKVRNNSCFIFGILNNRFVDLSYFQLQRIKRFILLHILSYSHFLKFRLSLVGHVFPVSKNIFLFSLSELIFPSLFLFTLNILKQVPFPHKPTYRFGLKLFIRLRRHKFFLFLLNQKRILFLEKFCIWHQIL